MSSSSPNKVLPDNPSTVVRILFSDVETGIGNSHGGGRIGNATGGGGAADSPLEELAASGGGEGGGGGDKSVLQAKLTNLAIQGCNSIVKNWLEKST